MKKLSVKDFIKLSKMVYRGARPLEFTMWRYAFENGSAEDFLSVIAGYQNEDGGFGYNMEANNWNPNSSPDITNYALCQLERVGYSFRDKNHPIVKGILKYLDSGEYLTETGWVGNIPSNNDYSHAPWFGYDSWKEDVRIFNAAVDFVLRYADNHSEIYQRVLAFNRIIKARKQELIPDFSDFDPTKWEAWKLSPLRFVKSPDSEHYQTYKKVVDMELDSIVDRLHSINELPVINLKDIKEAWEDSEQIIGGYYWASSDFIDQIQYLEKFGRLEFELPLNK